MSDFKPLSVIIPVYNEENTIIQCIESLLNGDYPASLIEFVVADGMSTDKTIEKLNVFSRQNPGLKIKMLKNTYKTQGYGLNIAIQNINDRSEIIIRADAHSVYPQNYIKQCVTALLESGADNAGGVMIPIGETPFQKAVAFCMTHPLGVGNAKFHLGGYSGFVDTVYLGCFKRDIFDKIGFFDPDMTPNEDAEFNLRILKSGGKIFLDSKIQVEYHPRNTIKKLMKQYFRYGSGRCRTVKKHRKLTSYRQAVPPLWVFTSILLVFMAFYSNFFLIPLYSYLFIIFIVSVKGSLRNKSLSILCAPLSFVIMHYAWGSGFICELVKFDDSKNKSKAEIS